MVPLSTPNLTKRRRASNSIARPRPTRRNENGKPTKALMGFARSCGVEVTELQQQETDKGAWLIFKATEKGHLLADLIEDIINQSLTRLPIPKRMRWGSSDAEFVRPVHWLVLLHGKNIINADILGLKSSAATFGHRFHSPGKIVLTDASSLSAPLHFFISTFSSNGPNKTL